MSPDSPNTPPGNGAKPVDSSANSASADDGAPNASSESGGRPSLLHPRESARAGRTPDASKGAREPESGRNGRRAEPPRTRPPVIPTTAAATASQRASIDKVLQQPRPEPPLRRYEPPVDTSMLRNPYVLAGTAVAGAILLAVVVVIFFGNSGGEGDTARRSNTPSSGAVVNPLTPQKGSGVQVRSIAAATVRTGPSIEFGEIGPLRSGQDLDVLGRNANSTWFEILFPPGSSFKGWVPATALRVPEQSIASIPVVDSTPIPRPTLDIPTSTPEPIRTQPPSVTPSITPTPGTPTPTPAVGSDLVAAPVAGSCAVGNQLRVNVRNAGPAAVSGKPVAVLVQNAQGVQKSIVSQVLTLAVGQEVIIDTGYTVQERVVAIVDPLGAAGDTNVGNNRVDCVVASAATATPRPATPTPPSSAATPTPTRTPAPTAPPQ